MKRIAPLSLSIFMLCGLVPSALGTGLLSFDSWTWNETQDSAEWEARAGLRVVELRNDLYLLGGRTPIDPAISPAPGASEIWGDVWKSSDKGASWTSILETDDSSHWPARAYFQVVTKGGRMYVIGGQNYKVIPNPDPLGPPFISVSDFFNDVWRSPDGVNWIIMTDDAGWEKRAGLSAVNHGGKIYVMGGSQNDDSAVIGGPPERIYFNDVWCSRDGKSWTQASPEAPWAPRAGAVVVSRGGWMYLFGGEDGFTCDSGDRCPPYFNDVWRSRDGENWELVIEEAPWSPRPGHQVVEVLNHFVLFGGFGLSTDPLDPFAPSNPMDVWVSKNGADWEMLADAPWNAATPGEIKYDFAAIATTSAGGGQHPRIMTFGGDRETFDFTDPFNYLNIDNDVWSFSLPLGADDDASEEVSNAGPARLHGAGPNPFNPSTSIAFTLEKAGWVRLNVYDLSGRLIRTLAEGTFGPGRHEIPWQGRDQDDRSVASGVYLYRLETDSFDEVRRMVLVE